MVGSSKHPIRSGGSGGYSVLELLVVIGIFVAVAALVWPNFRLWYDQSNLNGIARQVQADLMWARMEAVQRSCPVTATFVNNQQGYTIWMDIDRDSTQDTGEVINRSTAQDFKDVRFGSSIQIVFQARGTASSTGDVVLSNSQGSKTLSVNVAGRVRIS